MKSLALLTLIPALATSVFAADLGKLIFEDDFNRKETQTATDEPGNGWGTNSKSRAKGDKQVELKDGAMRIFISPRADHAVTVTHAAEFKDGAVTLRFMLEDAKDSLGLDFADAQCKEVHAGHLCAAKVDAKQVVLIDHKTGGMRNDIHLRGAEVASVDFLALRVREIEAEAVLRILEHEAQRHRAVLELRRMRHGHRMVRAGADENAHRTVLQLHLLVALCARLAVRAPAVAGFVRGRLRLLPVEVILEDELPEIGGEDGRGECRDEREEGEGFHAWDKSRISNRRKAANFVPRTNHVLWAKICEKA